MLPRKHFSDVPKGVELKVRCGGAEAHDFPQAEQLAGFIRFCADNDIPFKATAGLHRAVRHFDPTLGVDRHGFLNLLLAVCEAVEHRDPAPVLRSTDVDISYGWRAPCPREHAERARHLLVSYGSAAP